MKRKIMAFMLIVFMGFSSSVITQATQDRSGNFNTNYTLTGNAAEDMVIIANAQIGRNGGEFGYTEEWCADFISDCAVRTGQPNLIPRSGSCANLMNNIRNAGGWEVSLADAKKGDIAFYGTYGGVVGGAHVELISEVNNGTVSSIGGNCGNSNNSLSKVQSHPTQSVTGHGNPSVILRPAYRTNPPTNPQISISQSNLGLGDVLEVKGSADGKVDNYTIQIWQGATLRHTQSFTGDTFRMNCNQLGAGDYGCYLACTNSAGTVYTEIANFHVAEKISNTKISIKKTNLSLKDTLEIETSADGGVEFYTVQIWNGAELKRTEKFIGHQYSLACSQLGTGKYACYVAATNASGTVFTETIDFTVGELSDAQISIVKDKLDVKEILQVNASVAGGADYYTIQIWKEDQLLITQKFIGHTFSIPCEQLGEGEYGCYVACTNGTGTIYTSIAYFGIGTAIRNVGVSLNKSTYEKEDEIGMTFSSEGNIDGYYIEIYDEDMQIVYKEKTAEKEHHLEASKFMGGKYIVQVTAYNAVYKESSEKAGFTLMNQDDDVKPVISIIGNSGVIESVVDVYVQMENNPGIVGTTLGVTYDTDKLQLISCEDQGVLNDYQWSDLDHQPFLMNWEDPLATVNNTANGNIAKLQFKILKDLGEDGAELKLTIDTAYDVDINDVLFTAKSGKITMSKYKPGDMNDDGVINSKDSILLRKYVLGGSGVINKDAADVNHDGVVNSKDSILLRKYVLGGSVQLK